MSGIRKKSSPSCVSVCGVYVWGWWCMVYKCVLYVCGMSMFVHRICVLCMCVIWVCMVCLHIMYGMCLWYGYVVCLYVCTCVGMFVVYVDKCEWCTYVVCACVHANVEYVCLLCVCVLWVCGMMCVYSVGLWYVWWEYVVYMCLCLHKNKPSFSSYNFLSPFPLCIYKTQRSSR